MGDPRSDQTWNLRPLCGLVEPFSVFRVIKKLNCFLFRPERYGTPPFLANFIVLQQPALVSPDRLRDASCLVPDCDRIWDQLWGSLRDLLLGHGSPDCCRPPGQNVRRK